MVQLHEYDLLMGHNRLVSILVLLNYQSRNTYLSYVLPILDKQSEYFFEKLHHKVEDLILLLISNRAIFSYFHNAGPFCFLSIVKINVQLIYVVSNQTSIYRHQLLGNSIPMCLRRLCRRVSFELNLANL